MIIMTRLDTILRLNGSRINVDSPILYMYLLNIFSYFPMQILAGGRRLLGYYKRGRHSEKFGNHCYSWTGGSKALIRTQPCLSPFKGRVNRVYGWARLRSINY